MIFSKFKIGFITLEICNRKTLIIQNYITLIVQKIKVKIIYDLLKA